jgi:hypothetical protein
MGHGARHLKEEPATGSCISSVFVTLYSPVLQEKEFLFIQNPSSSRALKKGRGALLLFFLQQSLDLAMNTT